MSIKAKIFISFLTIALVPCMLFLALGIVQGQVSLFTILICIFSILIAIAVAWLLVKSFSQPLEDLAQYLGKIVNGNKNASMQERVYQASKEYVNLATLINTATTVLREDYVKSEQLLQECTAELEETSRNLSAKKEEVDRLNNVMIDRELKMIRMKASLREAYKQLGKEVETPVTPDEEITAQYNDPEQGRSAMLNLLEDLQTEKKLLETAKAKDDAILRSIGDGILVANSQGDITFLNDNARVLLDLEHVDADTNIQEQLPPILEAKTKKPLPIEELPLQKAVRGEIVVKQPLLIQNDQSTEGRWIEMTATPITVAGMPLGGVATFRDVTKEQEIDRAKTEFVSLASHQLRTPLSAINWYAEMLLAGDAGDLNEEQRSYLNEVYQGNQRMVDLINSLLNVSRLELGTLAVDPEDTDVIALAQSVLKELAPQVKEREINLTTNFSQETPHLYADPKLLRMVLQNLASNAIKYTPIGGSVSVYIAPKDKNIVITVADTGLGIPKADQSKIFSKLFRATNARESDTDGTGLGLYIIKSVVEHAGGTIRFTSEEGKGSIFFVELPMSGMQKKKGTKSLS